MSQFDFGTIVPRTKSGSALADDLMAWRTALHSTHKGPTAPAYLVAGMQWIDDTSNPIWSLKMYDEAQWIVLAYLDTTNNLAWPATTDARQRYPVAGGTTNAFTLTPVIALLAYADQDVMTFEAPSAITGATTLVVSGLATKAIRKVSGGTDVALAQGDIVAGGRYLVVYDAGANAGAGAWILFNPAVASLPTGATLGYAGRIAPAGYLMCYGQNVSRTTEPALFGVIAPTLGTVTVTIATPAVFTLNSHGLAVGDPISLETTGLLPTGLAIGTNYYVIAAGLTANAFQVSATVGGAAANTSGSQSGVHTARYTPFGPGDGLTTYGIPDHRGRVAAGKDNMGGSAANRLTTSVAGSTLGAAGGAETHTLTVAQMPAHTHANSLTDPGHTHVFPYAVHTVNGPDGNASVGGGSVFLLATNRSVSAATTGVTITNASAGSGAAHNIAQPTIVENKIIKT